MFEFMVTTVMVASLLCYHVTHSVPAAYGNQQNDVSHKLKEFNYKLPAGGPLFGRVSRGVGPHTSRYNDLIVDLRAHKLFMSNPRLDCCPTVTQLNRRSLGINPRGLVLELFQTENFTQAFYETMCDPSLKDRPCQFIQSNLAPFSRCIQQWSYVYAMGRTFGQFYEQFRFDYIRVATGCKCQLPASVVKEHGAASDQRPSVVLLQPSLDAAEP